MGIYMSGCVHSVIVYIGTYIIIYHGGMLPETAVYINSAVVYTT